MAVLARQGKKGSHLHIKRAVPGWGLFRKTAGTKSREAAASFDMMVRQLGATGAHDILDALRDDRISLARAYLVWGGGEGLAAIRAELAAAGSPSLRAALIAPLVPAFIAHGSDRKASRRAGTNAVYSQHMSALVAHLGGPETASLDDLTSAEKIRDFVEGIYRERLVDKVSLARTEARKSSLTQREWRELRIADRAELEAYPTAALAAMAAHEDRSAAGATANRKRATLAAFCAWLIRTRADYAAAVTGKNPVSSLKNYSESKHSVRHMARTEWALFRAGAQAFDQEYVTGVLSDDGVEQEVEIDADAQWPCTLLWDMLLATGARTFTEGVERICLADFRPASRADGLIQFEVRGTKTDLSASRLLWVDAALYDAAVAHAARWGLGHEDLLFSRVLGEARVGLDRSRVGRTFKRICRRVAARHGRPDFERFTPYSLRHTFAVWQIAGDPERGIPGVDLARLAHMMGHSELETTMRYASYKSDGQHHGAHLMAAAMGVSAQPPEPVAAPQVRPQGGPQGELLTALAGLSPDQVAALLALAKTLAPPK
jgi:integrase